LIYTIFQPIINSIGIFASKYGAAPVSRLPISQKNGKSILAGTKRKKAGGGKKLRRPIGKNHLPIRIFN
jgi:hypothetical protein